MENGFSSWGMDSRNLGSKVMLVTSPWLCEDVVDVLGEPEVDLPVCAPKSTSVFASNEVCQ